MQTEQEGNPDNEPVLVIITPDNYIKSAGMPAIASKDYLHECAMEGCTIKTIPLKEFKGLGLKWIWSKTNEI